MYSDNWTGHMSVWTYYWLKSIVSYCLMISTGIYTFSEYIVACQRGLCASVCVTVRPILLCVCVCVCLLGWLMFNFVPNVPFLNLPVFLACVNVSVYVCYPFWVCVLCLIEYVILCSHIHPPLPSVWCPCIRPSAFPAYCISQTERCASLIKSKTPGSCSIGPKMTTLEENQLQPEGSRPKSHSQREVEMCLPTTPAASWSPAAEARSRACAPNAADLCLYARWGYPNLMTANKRNLHFKFSFRICSQSNSGSTFASVHLGPWQQPWTSSRHCVHQADLEKSEEVEGSEEEEEATCQAGTPEGGRAVRGVLPMWGTRAHCPSLLSTSNLQPRTLDTTVAQLAGLTPWALCWLQHRTHPKPWTIRDQCI